MNMVLLNIGEYLRGRGVTNPTRQLIAHDMEHQNNCQICYWLIW